MACQILSGPAASPAWTVIRQPSRATEMIHKQRAGESQLVARQIQRGDPIAMGQQGVEFLFTGRLAEGAAHDANQTRFDAEITAALAYPGNHRFDDASDR